MDQQGKKTQSAKSEKLHATRVKSQWRFFGTLLVVVALLVVAYAFYHLLNKSIQQKSSAITASADGPNGLSSFNSVNVQGVGVASTRPDQARVSFSVETQAPTAAEAAQTNAQQTAALTAALKATDIHSTLSTENYSVYPISDNKQQITGYRANNTVAVQLKPATNTMIINQNSAAQLLEQRVAALIDTATQSGYASLVGGIEFSLTSSTRNLLLQQARSKAVENALLNATVLASSANRKLGPVVSISDASGQPEFVPMYRVLASSAPSADTASTPISAPQRIDVTANVGVIYRLEE